MRRFILVLIIISCMSIGAQALSITFQNPSDFTEHISTTCSGLCTISWIESSNGGNSYVYVQDLSNPGTAYIRNTDPQSTSYAAATLVGHTMTISEGYLTVRLYDSGGATLYTFTRTAALVNDGRYEVRMVGGAAKLYYNGRLIDSSGVLASNPYYVGFGAGRFGSIAGTSVALWDDYVFGTSENPNIFGSPEQGYFIKKDLINPASSGFAFPNGTIVSSFNMTSTYGFGNSNESRTVVLQNYGTGQVYSSITTAAGTMSGSTAWPIYDAIIASGAPQGYYVTTVLGTNEYSDPVRYSSIGSTVTWNSETYSRGDSASITYVTEPAYWIPLQYSYRVDVLDVTLSVVSTHPITVSSGTITTSFTDSDPLGVYYAVLKATPLAGGNDVWLGVGQTELTGYLVLTGWVNNATSALPIPIANVSISQGGVVYTKTTSFDGNYTTDVAFYSGIPTYFNITAPGYKQYNRSFTPIEAKTIALNFSLEQLTPSFYGIGLRGIVRDSTYGRPIPGVLVSIVNSTYGESYSSTTNNAGGYFADLTTGANFVSGRLYDIQGTRPGYNTSQIYKKVIL